MELDGVALPLEQGAVEGVGEDRARHPEDGIEDIPEASEKAGHRPYGREVPRGSCAPAIDGR